MTKSKNLRSGIDSVFSTAAKERRRTRKEKLQEENKAALKKAPLSGIDSLIRPYEEPTVGRPAKQKKNRSAAERGCKEDEIRYTVIFRKDQLQKLKDAAYWQRLSIKEIHAQAIDSFLSAYEKKNGKIKQGK